MEKNPEGEILKMSEDKILVTNIVIKSHKSQTQT